MAASVSKKSSVVSRKENGNGPTKIFNLALLLFLMVGSMDILYAQSSSNLFFREDWKEIEAALPVTQKHVSNPNLVLSLHGPGKEGVKKSNHPPIPNDPYYIWSGECRGNWALSLRHHSQMVDLTGQAEIHWRAKQSGFRQLRLILKLADGKWLVSDQYDGESEDWRTKVFKIADLQWRKLDIHRVTEGNWVDEPDLSRVEEVGFTDLMVGGQSPACSRLDWIAVYENQAKR
jgi:hypothetical protein